MDLGLSYDDVLLVPKRSPVKSRKEISTETYLTRNIKLKIPIVSANMDTVTEADMAIAMAELGGIGIIHRFNTIEQQVREVQKVKRYRTAFIENPITISANAKLGEAREIMAEHDITSLLVLDAKDKLVGILTSRDIRFKPPENVPIKNLMTPKEKLIVGKVGITIDGVKKLLMRHKIEKLPIIKSDWSLAGLITSKDLYKKTKYPDSTLDKKDKLIVGAAIGVKEDSLPRAEALINAGADVLCVDIAHGHSDLAIETVKKIKKKFPNVPLIAGNIATAEGAKDLIEAGADCIKVGVGPGSICTTRIVTGSGFPQLSAVMDCAKVADKYKIPIIADGGIKYSGDITKAIGAGASTVMLGSLLAGTEESPGIALIKNGKKYKVVRGMASYGAKFGREAKEKNKLSFEDVLDFVPEGIEANVPYRGNVSEVIHQLVGGLRSGMSYVGARKIEDFCGKAKFVQITAMGMRESHAHDVDVI